MYFLGGTLTIIHVFSTTLGEINGGMFNFFIFLLSLGWKCLPYSTPKNNTYGYIYLIIGT
jgi:hypothetical protein